MKNVKNDIMYKMNDLSQKIKTSILQYCVVTVKLNPSSLQGILWLKLLAV